mgnify:CR=1 FL=1
MNPRTLLVTGCSRGIGLAVTRRLLDEGHAVIGVSRQHPDVGDTGFIHVRLDLSDLQRLPEQLAEIAKSHPQIDGLVLNAGMGRFGALEQFSAAQVRQLIDLNLTSQVLIALAFLPKLKHRGAGDLVFVGSEAAIKGGRNGAVYSATKFALRGLASALARELAPQGVHVAHFVIDGGVLNPAKGRVPGPDDPEDRYLGLVNNRCSDQTSERAEVGNREGAARHVGHRQRAFLGPLKCGLFIV